VRTGARYREALERATESALLAAALLVVSLATRKKAEGPCAGRGIEASGRQLTRKVRPRSAPCGRPTSEVPMMHRVRATMIGVPAVVLISGGCGEQEIDRRPHYR